MTKTMLYNTCAHYLGGAVSFAFPPEVCFKQVGTHEVFEIIDRIRNCHVNGPPLKESDKAPSIVQIRPSGLEIDADLSLE